MSTVFPPTLQEVTPDLQDLAEHLDLQATYQQAASEQPCSWIWGEEKAALLAIRCSALEARRLAELQDLLDDLEAQVEPGLLYAEGAVRKLIEDIREGRA